MNSNQRIRLYITNGDLRNAAGQVVYEVFGAQNANQTTLGKQCAELQDNITVALESLKESLVQRLREVSIYEGEWNAEREVEPIVVYMRCLEALGVNTDREAEHVRQVMRDAIAKSDRKR